MDRLFSDLEKLVTEIEQLRRVTKPFTEEQREKFELWHHKVKSILVRIYGPRSDQVQTFGRIGYSSMIQSARIGAREHNEAYQRGLTKASAFLRSLLETDAIDVKGVGVRTTSTPAHPKCFISASFDPDADSVVEWFCDFARALGFDVVWLKDFAEPRPPEDKVKTHLKKADCLVQILTRDVGLQGKEKGWIGNEIAWSEEYHGPGKQGLFVEEGQRATGIGPQITEVVYFDRTRLQAVAPKAAAYLLTLLQNARAK